MDLFSEYVAKYACGCGCSDENAEESANMATQRLDEMSKMIDAIKSKINSGADIAPWQLTHIESVFNDLGDVHSSMEADAKSEEPESSSESIVLKLGEEGVLETLEPWLHTAAHAAHKLLPKMPLAPTATAEQKQQDYLALQRSLQEAKNRAQPPKQPILDVSIPAEQNSAAPVSLPKALQPARPSSDVRIA